MLIFMPYLELSYQVFDFIMSSTLILYLKPDIFYIYSKSIVILGQFLTINYLINLGFG